MKKAWGVTGAVAPIEKNWRASTIAIFASKGGGMRRRGDRAEAGAVELSQLSASQSWSGDHCIDGPCVGLAALHRSQMDSEWLQELVQFGVGKRTD